MALDVRRLEHYLQRFSKEAEHWFGGTPFVRKQWEFFKAFTAKAELEKAEWVDFKQIATHVHAFSEMPIARARAFKWQKHEIERYRDSFTFLVHGAGSVVERVNRFSDPSGPYKLEGFGDSAVSEVAGNCFADQLIFMNHRDTEAARFLGITWRKPSGGGLGDKIQAFTTAIEPVKERYEQIVGWRTDLPHYLELDQFFSWLSDKTEEALPALAEVPPEPVAVTVQSFVPQEMTAPAPGKSGAIPPTNLILYGPPGTGKTHHSIARAVQLADPETFELVKDNRAVMSQRFRELQAAGRIEFVTFHQSYGYEDFVESIRPVLADEKDEEGCGGPVYELFRGTFKRIADTAAEAWRRAEGPAAVDTGDVDLEHVRYWKMSLGRAKDPDEAHIFKECVEKGLLRLGYGRSVDFEGCNTRAEVEKKASALGQGETTFNVDAIHRFKNEMQVGDLVVVSDGNRRYRAVGQVAGPYKLRLDLERSQQTRPVKWLRVLPESLPAEQLLKINFSQQTIYRLDRDDLNMHALRELLASPKPNRRADYVLIIDEINRGNISKVLGELITLLEPDKRLGAPNELLLRLPSSPEKLFGVPPNLHIVGTMNTADRSIALMDVALRRRFVFEELMPCSTAIQEVLAAGSAEPGFVELVVRLFEAINGRIRFLYDRDHQLGHSFFLNLTGAKDLRDVFLQRVIPLLQEYFYGDWEKVCLVLGCPVDEKGKCPNPNPMVVAKLPDGSLFSQRYLRTTEVKPDFEVNPVFLKATTDAELLAFFAGIVGPQA